MQQSDQEIYPYQTDEIDLRALFNSLMARKFLIAGLTGFVTVVAILYALNIAPTYLVTSSFTSPNESSVISINKLGMTKETKESVFSSFLTQLSSKDLQRELFVEGDYVTQFNADNAPIDDVDGFISNTIKSVEVRSPNLNKKDMDLGFLTELPYSVSIEGNNPEAMSTYLNQLVLLANSKTINELITLNELKISNRIEEISLERDLLLEQAEKDRFSQIERIKEEDAQKIRQLNDQIDRARYQAKENRLNQIVVLIDAAKLANSLGIIENNFKLIKGDGASSDLTIAIGENKDLPEWYLYGEKALLQRVELLQNRTSDDPFIPELVTLNNQLNEVQNNNALKTLETRQDDSPFIAEIAKLDVEKIKLKSRIVAMISVSAMQLSQVALIPKDPIKPNKRLIVLLAFIGSFIMSILLALIMGALKPEEKTPA
jgi:chain length determinant protein (polysaccharide antigen chain regulator)